MVFLLTSLIFFASADQTEIATYGDARHALWTELYSSSSTDSHQSLYCQKTFKGRKGLNVEHVFARSWMSESLPECRDVNRKTCRRISRRFNFMESDLHNLYPSINSINHARASFIFDDIEGYYLQDGCFFEMGDRIVEPPDYAKGRVARAILYMTLEYNVNLDQVTNSPGFKTKMLNWHCKFPPSPEEMNRNASILRLQGNSNPFITSSKDFCS